MSEVINQPEINAPSTVVANELELLKARADKLGIKYSPNIGIETLKERINSVLSPEKVVTEVNAEDEERNRVRNDALKLIRCQIVNLNPNKKPFILDQKLWIEIIYQLKKNFSDDSFSPMFFLSSSNKRTSLPSGNFTPACSQIQVAGIPATGPFTPWLSLKTKSSIFL